MKKDVEQKHKKARGTISACAPKGQENVATYKNVANNVTDC